MTLACLAFGDTGAPIGTVNLAEGDVNREPEGRVRTGVGNCEILLTPGVFLRLGHRSAVTVSAKDAATVDVTLSAGRALIEAVSVQPTEEVVIVLAGRRLALLEPGLYAFDAAASTVAVYGGKVRISGAPADVLLKRGAQFILSGSGRMEKFDAKAARSGDELYQWSKTRAAALARITREESPTWVLKKRPWSGAGWYASDSGTFVFFPASGSVTSVLGSEYVSPYAAYAGTV